MRVLILSDHIIAPGKIARRGEVVELEDNVARFRLRLGWVKPAPAPASAPPVASDRPAAGEADAPQASGPSPPASLETSPPAAPPKGGKPGKKESTK
jgi:hypothetical protein